AAVTAIFYFILNALDTPNILFSTISVATSFSAAFLVVLRNPLYAVCYAANDLVLIVLWTLATMTDISYFAMIICFVIFFVNDIYGFANWRKMAKRQFTEEYKKI
ncbi:MAG: nicotinamide mononucleotide transporter, partial [Clostridia bacterium]|nr:nicotinamide mononucleotide transporter [Clostridia bacterium]